jgi:hypothetical protein
MIVNRDYKRIATAKVTLDCGEGKLMEFSPAKRKWVFVQPAQPGSSVSAVLREGDGRLFEVVR